jgi:ornithine decarboxylase
MITMHLAPEGGRAARSRFRSTKADRLISQPGETAFAPALRAIDGEVQVANDHALTLRQPKAELTVVPPQPGARGEITAKAAAFLDRLQPETPALVIDLDVVEGNYLGLAASLRPAEIFYAVKANPAPEVLRLLARRGSSFDVASRGEIDLCLEVGITADRISFGNTIKKAGDIAYAHRRGVKLFAFDSEGELEKLAQHAPGAGVFCRLLVEGEGAEWPLSRKFGCSFAMAKDLLLRARDLGLEALGVSFHIGSQQCDLSQWDKLLARIGAFYAELRAAGLEPSLLNLGGGFPARYRKDVPSMADYGRRVIGAVVRNLGPKLPRLLVEPGRGLVGEAGVIECEVVLVSKKDSGDEARWVYLDIGKFSGLAETMDEAIKYRFVTPYDGGPTGPVVIAGPSCDSADILYEKTRYELPLALKAGDKLRILATGAYTSTYATVGFNGFPPLKAYCI